LQHLVGRAKRDADKLRDDVSDYVGEHLHDDEAVLVVDETGDVKKGTNTVGVQRQYTGTGGRIENGQAAVYLVYAGRRGQRRGRPGTLCSAFPGPPAPTAAGPPDSLGARRWIKVAG